MKIKLIKLIVLLMILITSIAVSAQEVPVKKSQITEDIDGVEYYLHFVKNGETLYNIAAAYGLTVSKIFQSNPEAKNGISPGQILKIPSGEKKTIQAEITEPETDFFYHIVKTQETLYGISKKYGVSIDEIKKLNPEMGDYPKAGQTLKVPEVKNSALIAEPNFEGEIIKHQVRKGETLYGIAKEYNVTIGEIRNANPDLGFTLDIGMMISIPNQNIQPIVEEKEEEPEDLQFIEHKVLAGETLYTIARNNSISIDTLKKYNYGLTENLYVGQAIQIPNRERSAGFITHKSSKKDKVQNIANKYDISVAEVIAINPGIQKKVSKGSEIKIPVKEQPIVIMDTIPDFQLDTELGTSLCYRAENKEKTYNIALMIPLFLEEIDSLYVREDQDLSTLVQLKSFKFIQFYEGFKMAVDSMKNQGMNLNLFVYDVDNSSAKTDAVLLTSELSSMDLIVGPFYGKSFEKVAAFAKTYNINIVNPLSEREEIIFDNPNVFKVKPSVQTQSDIIAEMIPEHFPEDNIILVRHNKYKYQQIVSFLKNTINTSRNTRIAISNQDLLDYIKKKDEGNKIYAETTVLDKAKLSEYPERETFFSNTVKEAIYSEDSIGGIKINLNPVRNNIVIAITDQNVFSQELYSQLNKLSSDFPITLIALPGWKEPEDFESDHLLNLNYHHFTSGIIDASDESVKQWILQYRELFKTDPSHQEYAFDGFDTGFYFLNALFHFGHDFGPCLSNMSIKLLNTKYIYKQQNNDGYQNIYWDLCEYKDFNVEKVDYNPN
jgi:LysM repeat protein